MEISYTEKILRLSILFSHLLSDADIERARRSGKYLSPQAVGDEERNKQSLCFHAAAVIRISEDLLDEMPQEYVDGAMDITFGEEGDRDLYEWNVQYP